jgi:hypothetical protein
MKPGSGLIFGIIICRLRSAARVLPWWRAPRGRGAWGGAGGQHGAGAGLGADGAYGPAALVGPGRAGCGW